MGNECVECGLYLAEFWVCDGCQAKQRIDLDPASDHDPDTYNEAAFGVGL
jgi:hypothetical protein